MRFLSVCSGMEAASVALAPLGFAPVMFSEIEDAPVAVLNYRHRAWDLREGPAHADDVPLWGDFSALRVRHMRRFGIPMPELLVGGTPCQGFSIAGLRGSLGDDRSNLALAFVRLAHAIDNVRSRAGQRGLVVLWENVPGVLSTKDNAFGCVLGGFVGADDALRSPLERGRWPDAGMVAGPRTRAAWRVLDAQYFGLAQRRERVFLVVSFRDGPDPGAILFERASVHGNPAPRRESGERTAASVTASVGGISKKDDIDGRVIGYGGNRTSGPLEVAAGLRANGRPLFDFESETFLHHVSYVPEVASTMPAGKNETGGDRPPGAGQETAAGYLVVADPICANEQRTYTHEGKTFRTRNLIPFDTTQITHPENRSKPEPGDPSPTLPKRGHPPAIAFSCKDSGEDATNELSPSLGAMGFNASHANGGGQVAVAFKPSHYTRDKDSGPTEIVPPLSADADKGDQDLVIFQTRGSNLSIGDQSGTLGRNADSAAGGAPMMLLQSAVRRLTPTECERLQGFPDGYSLVPYRNGMMSDSARYRMLGNSFAVPVIAWIGARIEAAYEEVSHSSVAS